MGVDHAAKNSRRAFRDKDQLEFDGVRVAFLNFFGQDPLLEPP
jgi:hypothetical protein